VPTIPLIEELTKGPVAPGSNLHVFFDPASCWYAASVEITAGWIKTGGGLNYTALGQSPTSIRSQLKDLGLDASELEKNEQLRILDGYTATLGQKSMEKYVYESLKTADLSIDFAKGLMVDPPIPDRLRIADNISVLARFNDEKTLVEFYNSRVIPAAQIRQSTLVSGVMKDVHSAWYLKQMEAVSDGIIDLKLDDTGEEPRNLMRIRAMRKVAFDGRWHELKVKENFEVTLDK
jgi:KaiC/GvpD/RAD55 family RecA-like ATPase